MFSKRIQVIPGLSGGAVVRLSNSKKMKKKEKWWKRKKKKKIRKQENKTNKTDKFSLLIILYRLFMYQRMQCKALCRAIYHLYINHTRSSPILVHTYTPSVITVISRHRWFVVTVLHEFFWLRRSQAYHWLLIPFDVMSRSFEVRYTNKRAIASVR